MGRLRAIEEFRKEIIDCDYEFSRRGDVGGWGGNEAGEEAVGEGLAGRGEGGLDDGVVLWGWLLVGWRFEGEEGGMYAVECEDDSVAD